MGLKYYDETKYEPLSDLSRKANIKTKNHLMAFYDSSWKYFPYTGISTGAYIFFQGGTIEHVTHVPVPVAQSSAENEYNAVCTTGMVLLHFSMLIHEFLKKICPIN